MRKLRDKRGFTLVELIVVLVILAVLAAILVPTLIGYIDQARHEKDYSTAAALEQAAQSVVIEQKKEHPNWSWAQLSPVTSTDRLSTNGRPEKDEVAYLAGVDTSHVKWFYFNVDSDGKVTSTIQKNNPTTTINSKSDQPGYSSNNFPSCVCIDDTVYYLRGDGSWGTSKLDNNSFATSGLSTYDHSKPQGSSAADSQSWTQDGWKSIG